MTRWWQTWWIGGEAGNPTEERTSENLERRSETYFGGKSRAAEGRDGIGEEVKMRDGWPGEEQNTFWLATSKRRLRWGIKSTPKIGTETGAS